MADNDRSIRVGKLSDQGKEDDLRNTTPEQRIAMMWQLAVDGYAMLGVHADEREFPRDFDGVIRGRV
jgi:hypothetical protein